MTRRLRKFFFATAVVLVTGLPAWAQPTDQVSTRFGEFFEGKGIVLEEDFRGVRIALETESATRQLRPYEIDRVIHGDEPSVYRHALERMEQGDYDTAKRRLLAARSTAQVGAWFQSAVSFQLGRCYMLWGRADSDLLALLEARGYFQAVLNHNADSFYRARIQHALGEIYLTAADLSGPGKERLEFLDSARQRFRALLDDAGGGAYHYNGFDPKARWELRARIGLLACDARHQLGHRLASIPTRLDNLIRTAQKRGLPDAAADGVLEKYAYLLNHTNWLDRSGARAGLVAIDKLVRNLTKPDGSVAADQERRLCRLHQTAARLHERLTKVEPDRKKEHDKKALLLHYRVVILYANSTEARLEVGQAHLAAVTVLIRVEGLQQTNAAAEARELLEQLKARFPQSRAWVHKGAKLYEQIKR